MDNQRPNWPPAPTVEDEVLGEQTTPTPMPGAQNNAHAQTPVNDNTTTPAPNDDAAPHTPANGNAAAAPAADRVQIVLKDQGGTQVAFGVKSSTRMEKVMNAYAERSARPVGTLRFHFDGERVLPDDTTASLNMEEGDIIEVMTEQIGGNGEHKIAPTTLDTYIAKHDIESDTEEVSFVVNAVEVGGKPIKSMEFVVAPDIKVRDFKAAWAQRAGCSLGEVIFRRNAEMEGPGLPFYSEDETFGDIDFIRGDEIFVNALTEEPINLARPREDVSIKDLSTGSGTPTDTIVITVKYPVEDGDDWELHCKMTKTMSFDKLINMYSERWDLDASKQRLTFNGKTVFPSDTPVLIGARDSATLNIGEETDVCTMDLTLD